MMKNDDFKAIEVAEKLKLQLKKLELIRLSIRSIIKKKKIRKRHFYAWDERNY